MSESGPGLRGRPGTLSGLHHCGLLIAGLLLTGVASGQDTPSHSGSDEPATSTTIVGTIRLLAENGEAIDDRREFANAVAYFESDQLEPSPPTEQRAYLATDRRQFDPRVLIIQAGTEVVFPNEDPILHNVFSSSPGNQFDLGLYGQSPGKTHRFETPGLARVFCNVHPAMSAHIVIARSPHFTHPDSNGRFRIDNVPAVAGQLTVWHERSEARQFRIEPGQDLIDLGPIDLALTVRQISPQRERIRRPARRGRY